MKKVGLISIALPLALLCGDFYNSATASETESEKTDATDKGEKKEDMERTFAIIKPDAADKADEINKMIEAAGLKVIAKKTIKLTLEQSKEFYAVHKDRPFYNDLCEFMSSGDSVVEVIEGPEAVSRYRNLMGATDSRKAEEGTIRKVFGTDNQKNAVHGSDSLENAEKEISFFFSKEEIGG